MTTSESGHTSKSPGVSDLSTGLERAHRIHFSAAPTAAAPERALPWDTLLKRFLESVQFAEHWATPARHFVPANVLQHFADREHAWKFLQAAIDSEHTSQPSTEALFGPAQQFTSDAARELALLRRQVAELRVENELLKSRVAEEKRTANREIQRSDQAISSLDRAIGAIQDRAQANDSLLRLTMERSAGHLILFETLEGVVRSATDQEIHALFDVGDDLIEQLYESSQFLEGKSPKPGDRLTVFVHMTRFPPEAPEPIEEAEELDGEQSPRRKNAIKGPHKF